MSSVRSLPDLNIQDLTGDTPLHLASKSGHHGIVDLLISNGANPRLANVRGYNCMHLATLGDHEKVIKVIAQRDKELLNIRDSFGLAPIHLALFGNKTKSFNVSNQSDYGICQYCFARLKQYLALDLYSRTLFVLFLDTTRVQRIGQRYSILGWTNSFSYCV